MKYAFIIFYLAMGVLVGGASVLIGGSFGSTKVTEIYPDPVEKEKTNIAETLETAMNEIKAMPLLELIDLKEKIIDFKNTTTDFEMDISGILEVFK